MPLEKEAKPAATAARQTLQPFFSTTATQPQPEHFLKRTIKPETIEAGMASQHADAEQEVAQTDTDPTSPMRQEVFKLFELLNKQGVLATPGSPKGSEDADWKEITGYTQEDWNTRKKLEEPWTKWREYKDQKAAYEVYLNSLDLVAKGLRKKPLPEIKKPEEVPMPVGDPVSKLTTCILVQTKILARASKNLNLSYDTAHLMDPKMMETSPAWNWASPHLAERPAPGDIFVLISLGEKLNKAKMAMSRAQNQSPKDLQRLKDASDRTEGIVKGWQDKAFAEANTIDLLELKIAIVEKDMLKNKGALKQAKDMLKQYHGALKVAMKQAETARKALDDALTAKERAQKMLEDARTGEQFRTQLFFSHVGFFVSKEPHPDDPTKELWKTFDGGQTFTEGKTTKQGAKYVDRVYDPATNEIWAKPHQKGQIESQDGQTRWFLGWYNLDKLLKPKEEKKQHTK